MAMSKAAKKGGYRLRFNEAEGTVVVMTGDWLVDIERDKLPRKALALIVEHFGYLPDSGCFEVTKCRDEFEAQGYMNSSFNSDVLAFAGGTQEPVMNTYCMIWGKEIWAGEGGKLHGVRPELFSLCGRPAAGQLTSGGRLAFLDEDSAIFLDACGSEALPEGKLMIWETLESIDWWKMKESEEGAAEAGSPEGEAAEQLDFYELGDPPAADEPVDPPAFYEPIDPPGADEPVDPPGADEPADELVADEDFSQEVDYGD